MYNKTKLSTEDVEGYVKKINAIDRLSHPNVVKYFGIYKDDKYLYIVTEYLGGGNLYKKLTQESHRFTEEDTGLVIQKLMSALRALHKTSGKDGLKASPILHSEIKLQNIYFNSANEPKLVNFGISETTT